MKNLPPLISAILLSSIFIFCNSACTVLGVVIGSFADTRASKLNTPEKDEIIPVQEWEKIENLKEGTSIKVVKKDNTIIRGDYVNPIAIIVKEQSTPAIIVKLHEEKTNKFVSKNEIDHVIVLGRKKHQGQVTGMLIGAGIDVIIVIIAIISLSSGFTW